MSLSKDEKRKLLKRIARLKRTAAMHRLRGTIQKALQYERQVDRLVAYAEKHRLAGAAMSAEERGVESARELHRKTGLYRKRVQHRRKSRARRSTKRRGRR